MLKIQRNSKGFTLIELLIVIAIIGILAAIAIPSYTGYTKRAKVQEVVHAMGAVKTAVMAYYTESTMVKPCANAADVNTYYGVQLPDRYIDTITVSGSDTAWAAGQGTIAVIFTSSTGAGKKQIGSGVDGATLTLTPTRDYKNWNWTGSSGFESYVPKS